MRLMTGKRAGTLLELMHRIEYFTLARAWEGLTDDEFFWEPFTMTWSIRRQGQCRTPNPFGAGEWMADFAIPEPVPVPMTTIAWLYWHIGSMPGRLCDIDLLGGTRTMASGWTSPYLTHHPIFTRVAEAVTTLRDGWHRLRDVIERAVLSRRPRWPGGRGMVTAARGRPPDSPPPRRSAGLWTRGADGHVWPGSWCPGYGLEATAATGSGSASPAGDGRRGNSPRWPGHARWG